MDRPVLLIFPYPDKVLRPIGNQSGLEMDSKLKNFNKLNRTPQYDLPDLPQYHLPELRGRRGLRDGRFLTT